MFSNCPNISVMTILNCVFRTLKILVLLQLSLCSIIDCWIMSKADCKFEKSNPAACHYTFSGTHLNHLLQQLVFSLTNHLWTSLLWLSTPMVVNLLRWGQCGHGTWGSWCHCPGEGIQSKPGLTPHCEAIL